MTAGGGSLLLVLAILGASSSALRREADEALDRRDPPRVVRSLGALSDAGRSEDVERLLPAARRLLERSGRWSEILALGEIAASVGRNALAQEIFRAAEAKARAEGSGAGTRSAGRFRKFTPRADSRRARERDEANREATEAILGVLAGAHRRREGEEDPSSRPASGPASRSDGGFGIQILVPRPGEGSVPISEEEPDCGDWCGCAMRGGECAGGSY